MYYMMSIHGALRSSCPFDSTIFTHFVWVNESVAISNQVYSANLTLYVSYIFFTSIVSLWATITTTTPPHPFRVLTRSGIIKVTDLTMDDRNENNKPIGKGNKNIQYWIKADQSICQLCLVVLLLLCAVRSGWKPEYYWLCWTGKHQPVYIKYLQIVQTSRVRKKIIMSKSVEYTFYYSICVWVSSGNLILFHSNRLHIQYKFIQ